ncbi:MAG: glycerophosphodiester phosphodiesterase [Saprospirales bacterium]|nr:MAG: glycerophosphodiester phosphodiesterase [Saprospirales bacterium]
MFYLVRIVLKSLILSCILLSCNHSPDNQSRIPNGLKSIEGSSAPFNWPEVSPYYYFTEDIYSFFTPGSAPERMISAHRGSRFYPGWPENCIESFEYIIGELPAVLEMDLRMSKDSIIFLLHDETLDRTTTGQGRADQLVWNEIKHLQLLDHYGDTTNFNPSSLQDVLKWSRGKAILKLDIKRNVPFERVVRQIRTENAVNRVLVIVYSLNAAIAFNSLAPEIMISLPVRNFQELDLLLESRLPNERVVAFTGTQKTDQKIYEELNKNGIIAIQGTIGNLDQRAKAKGFNTIAEFFELGAGMIATDYPVELFNELSN